jgi:hypothetical protein
MEWSTVSASELKYCLFRTKYVYTTVHGQLATVALDYPRTFIND